MPIRSLTLNTKKLEKLNDMILVCIICAVWSFVKRKTLTWRQPYLRKLVFMKMHAFFMEIQGNACIASPNFHKMCAKILDFQWKVTFSFKNLMGAEGYHLVLDYFRENAHMYFHAISMKMHAFRKTLAARTIFWLISFAVWKLKVM